MLEILLAAIVGLIGGVVGGWLMFCYRPEQSDGPERCPTCGHQPEGHHYWCHRPALTDGSDDTDMTNEEFDQAMAKNLPVRVVTESPNCTDND